MFLFKMSSKEEAFFKSLRETKSFDLQFFSTVIGHLWKKTLVISIIAIVSGIILALSIPKKYTASATIYLYPEDELLEYVDVNEVSNIMGLWGTGLGNLKAPKMITSALVSELLRSYPILSKATFTPVDYEYATNPINYVQYYEELRPSVAISNIWAEPIIKDIPSPQKFKENSIGFGDAADLTQYEHIILHHLASRLRTDEIDPQGIIKVEFDHYDRIAATNTLSIILKELNKRINEIYNIENTKDVSFLKSSILKSKQELVKLQNSPEDFSKEEPISLLNSSIIRLEQELRLAELKVDRTTGGVHQIDPLKYEYFTNGPSNKMIIILFTFAVLFSFFLIVGLRFFIYALKNA